MKILRLLLSVLLLNNALTQAKCPEQTDLFQRFRRDIIIELQDHQQCIVWDEETGESFCNLMISWPADSIAVHLDDSIPALRSILFTALLQKNTDTNVLNSILQAHRYDTAAFCTQSADLVLSQNVIESMLFNREHSKQRTLPHRENFKARLLQLQKQQQQAIKLYIPGAYHGRISKAKLLGLQKFSCTAAGFHIDSLTMLIGDQTFTTSDSLTTGMRNAIDKLKAGDFIFLEEILVRDPTGTVRRFNPKRIRIE